MIGIVGGTGLYDLELAARQWRRVDSPFGTPSDELLFGRLGDHDVVFLPRHGRGHRIPPNAIDYRANIDALKRAGATRVISMSAVGSLRAELAPGTFVIVDQLIDRTPRANKSFFGPGCVAHVALGHPTCRTIGGELAAIAGELGLPVAPRGTYVVMDGPQFSTMAESEMHRMLGADVVGMTNMPEAKLAREAELCYATVAMVTDFDCWHPDHDHVQLDHVIRVLRDNADRARALVARAIPRVAALATPCPSGCDRALDNAIVTAAEARDAALVAKLDAVAGRVLRRS